jgi:hypothetical protein
MPTHRNAKLGPSGRYALVRTIEGRNSLREAGGSHGVAPAIACRWWRRLRQAHERERRTLSWLIDRGAGAIAARASLPKGEKERICQARRATGWGPRIAAGALGHPHSTVWNFLRRAGLSRPKRGAPEAANHSG